MSRARGLLAALVLCAVGAVLALAASGRPWVRLESRVETPSPGRPDAFVVTTVEREGDDVAPGSRALALVSLAGTAALVGARGWGRPAVGVVLIAAGAGTAALAARETGAGMTGAVPASLAGGLLVLTGGSLTAVAGRGWPALGARYDPPSGPAPRDEFGAAWDEVDADEGSSPAG